MGLQKTCKGMMGNELARSNWAVTASRSRSPDSSARALPATVNIAKVPARGLQVSVNLNAGLGLEVHSLRGILYSNQKSILGAQKLQSPCISPNAGALFCQKALNLSRA